MLRRMGALRGAGEWRRGVLDAVMIWTARLGGVLAVAVLLPAALRTPARLRDPGFLLMFVAYAGVVGLRFRPHWRYSLRAFGFCALMFLTGTAALASVGLLPGPTLVCAFVVIAARLFLGARAMLVALALTTPAFVFAARAHAGQVWADAESLGAWFWVREGAGFAMPTASIAMIVAHVVAQLERSLDATSEALRRLSATEAERERTQLTLAKTEEALLRSQKLEAVGRLAAGVGHDFNNTLQVMLSWASILRDERDESSLDEGLEAIERAALQGRELTQRLLEFGRRDVRAPTRSSPLELVRDSAHSLRRLLPEDISIDLDLDESAPALLVDPAQLAHVLLNLGVNARDAMPAGGALRLAVASLAASELPTGTVLPMPSEQVVRLSMSDTGEGMTQETLSHLFEPFYTTKGERGTGLGLATAYSVVQRNGGCIRVESEVGRGSTFHLYFPAQSGGSEAAEVERATPRRDSRARAVVMVAEDDADVRQTIVRVLGGAGYRVLESCDASSAIALLEQRGGEVDLLCTDGIMPGGGTRQLIDRYLGYRPDGRVIVCSGYVQEELLRRDLDAGAHAYLPKPFLVTELLERIDRMLQAH
jgi:two-component system, cell cycle sensor histidine kinase and response regulator CckA